MAKTGKFYKLPTDQLYDLSSQCCGYLRDPEYLGTVDGKPFITGKCCKKKPCKDLEGSCESL